jgi:hypothetical protein
MLGFAQLEMKLRVKTKVKSMGWAYLVGCSSPANGPEMTWTPGVGRQRQSWPREGEGERWEKGRRQVSRVV